MVAKARSGYILFVDGPKNGKSEKDDGLPMHVFYAKEGIGKYRRQRVEDYERNEDGEIVYEKNRSTAVDAPPLCPKVVNTEEVYVWRGWQ